MHAHACEHNGGSVASAHAQRERERERERERWKERDRKRERERERDVTALILSPFSLLTQQSSGPLKLLVSHHHRSSNCSDLSLHSGSNLSSSLASSTQPLYDEILAPSGYRIGEPKSILIKKVIILMLREIDTV